MKVSNLTSVMMILQTKIGVCLPHWSIETTR